MKDPALLAEAKKTKVFVEPTTGEQVHALIERIYATPKTWSPRRSKPARASIERQLVDIEESCP